MKIKVNTHVIVGSKQQPVAPGSVVEKVSKEEADALVAAGFATIVGEDEADKEKGPSLLDGNVSEVLAGLDGLSKAELTALRKEEVAGKNRAGVLGGIDSAVANAE